MVSGLLYSTIYQRVSSELSYALTMMHQRSVSSRSLHLNIWSNATQLNDITLLMHMHTSIDNNNTFYTDVNGLHLMRRRYEQNIPLEANIYPMASEAMIEDARVRLTVIAGQPTGVTSSTSGSLDLMLDRRLIGDDGKGVGFGEASESYPSELKYRIIVEKRQSYSNEFTLYHSSTVQRSLDELIYPADLFIALQQRNGISLPRASLFQPLPCNIQLVNLRYISQNLVIVILRRLPYSCDVVSNLEDCSTDSDLITAFFQSLGGRVFEMNLTGTSQGAEIKPVDIAQCLSTPLEICSFGVQLSG
ncbi:unnamed protein product [Toxocara canis]|nr:unnamed protein product [Toxocara canis]